MKDPMIAYELGSDLIEIAEMVKIHPPKFVELDPHGAMVDPAHGVPSAMCRAPAPGQAGLNVPAFACPGICGSSWSTWSIAG